MSTPTPQHCPTPRELDDLELLTTGALAPLTGFNEPGSAVTLDLPDDLAGAEAVELVDPEGLPLAALAADGSVTPLTHAQFGPFRGLYLTPTQAREQYAGATWVPVVGPLTDGQLARLGEEPGPLVLLTLAGTGTPQGLSTVGLVRATLAGAARLPDAAVVVVPLASHGDHEADHALGVQVVDNYAADDPILALPSASLEEASSTSVVEEASARSVVVEASSRSVVEEVAQQPSRDHYPPEVESIIDFDRPVPEEQGLVLFFTGLSGSGKSTLARALMDRLLEQGTRTVTSLDGDVVRRNLSAGLTFSKADRETNIRRIGWVAAEISRHGGVAVCSPIAPFDETRQQVRAMVEEAGGAFFLVHVATPLEECERRDRKGLYAKARRGEIPEFTGISSPYEEPQDAAVRVDTTGRSIEAVLDDVIDALRDTGYLDLPKSLVEEGAQESPVEEGAQRLSRNQDPQESLVEEVAQPSPSLVEEGAGASVVEEVAQGSLVEEGAGASVVEEVAQQPSRDPDHDPTPIKVLFVCTANICRSAFMHLYAEHLLRDNPAVKVTSAGTHGFVDHPMDATMAAELTSHGIDHAQFRSRRLTTEMIDEADLVLTAEVAHRSFILDDHAQAFRKVLTLGQATEAASHVDPSLGGRALLAEFARHRGMAEARHDIADPYRRGPVAARECARQVTQLVDGIIGALSRST